jgi:hypothetical protein
VLRGQPFVAEIAIDLVNALQAAHQQALQVQLRRDAQVQVDIQRVVMRDEGTRRRAAIERLHHGRFHFHESMAFELAAKRSDNAAAREEDFAHFGVRDQIQVALAVARFHVFQAMPFLGHGEQRLREVLQMFDVHAQFAGAGAEQVAFHADDVAQIDQLVDGEIALGKGVLLDVDLQALAILRQMREPGLAHAAQGLHAPGDAHAHRRGQFFRGLRTVFSQNGGDRVAEFEALAVGPETQRLDLANALQALLQ